ncbi:polysaccharide biosynthesis C-terminal domain-containing protein [Desulfosarcina cetonica]|uniref:polysaccharide biosynthesis C-terminal domain-containing protein n=1 Tax=Desulfosarcina cetonica TaxID=90730 RepID=UPI00155D9A49
MNIILNILLIPVFSYYGAAAATVVSETLILAIYLVAVKKGCLELMPGEAGH